MTRKFMIYNRAAYMLMEEEALEITRDELNRKWNKEDLQYRCTQEGFDIYESKRYWDRMYCVKER